MNSILGLIAILVVWGAILGLYFLPTIVAVQRKVRNPGSIIVINVFLGWTLIGWVVALALSFSSVEPTVRPSVQSPALPLDGRFAGYAEEDSEQ